MAVHCAKCGIVFKDGWVHTCKIKEPMPTVAVTKSIKDAFLLYVPNDGIYAKYGTSEKERCCNYRSDGTHSIDTIPQFWCCLPPEHKGAHVAYSMQKVGEKAPVKTWTEALAVPATAPCCILCKQTLCIICGLCETEECRIKGKRAVTATDLASLRHLLARTQKVRGYVALAGSNIVVPTPYKVIGAVEDIESAVAAMGATTIFVRPCPIRPRHGFVESRPVTAGSTKEIRKIWDEAVQDDPEAELLLCPVVPATHNMIITPTRMAIGPGNDGATAGKSSVVVPLAGVSFLELKDDILKKAGIDNTTEDPYIEVVAVNGAAGNYLTQGTKGVSFTQLRAGVKIPATVGADYVPEEMTVRRVIEASGDLLEWERQAALLRHGDVVYHLGGTLISHYGVHCMFNKIACVTSHKPSVGEVLKKEDNASSPDPRSIAEGLAIGTRFGLEQGLAVSVLGKISCNQAALIVMYSLHNAAAMGGRDGFWLGIGTAFMMRLGMAASHGEARHSDSVRRSLLREHIYKLALNDFFTARSTLGIAQERFKHYAWGGGYGGKKWELCTDSVFRMDHAVRELLTTPSTETVTELVAALNNAVNQAHNGGWWLNKFIAVDAFEKSAKQSLYTLASAAPGLHNVLTSSRDGIEAIIEKWRTAEKIVVPDSPVCYEDGTIKAIKAAKVPASAGTDVSSGSNLKNLLAKVEAKAKDDTAVPTDPLFGPVLAKPSYTHTAATKKLKVSAGKSSAYAIGPTSNMNGVVKVPADAIVTAAHGHMVSTDMHVQVRIEGQLGYYSFNVKLPKYVSDVQHKDPSYSGSETLYAQLETSHQVNNNYAGDLVLKHKAFGEVHLPSLAAVAGKD